MNITENGTARTQEIRIIDIRIRPISKADKEFSEYFSIIYNISQFKVKWCIETSLFIIRCMKSGKIHFCDNIVIIFEF